MVRLIYQHLTVFMQQEENITTMILIFMCVIWYLLLLMQSWHSNMWLLLEGCYQRWRFKTIHQSKVIQNIHNMQCKFISFNGLWRKFLSIMRMWMTKCLPIYLKADNAQSSMSLLNCAKNGIVWSFNWESNLKQGHHHF